MKVRKAVPGDLPALLALYDEARRFMCAAGNPHQWTGGYPGRALVAGDIAAGRQYILEEDGALLAAFCYEEGPAPEPTYAAIDGAWLRPGPYGVLHRVAVAGAARGRGAAAACFAWCFARCGNLRADTHADNAPMQRALEKAGFVRCGAIRLADGSPRIAYQKIGGEFCVSPTENAPPARRSSAAALVDKPPCG